MQEGQVVDPSALVDALEGPLIIIKVRVGPHEEVALALLRRRGERVPEDVLAPVAAEGPPHAPPRAPGAAVEDVQQRRPERLRARLLGPQVDDPVVFCDFDRAPGVVSSRLRRGALRFAVDAARRGEKRSFPFSTRTPTRRRRSITS